VSESRPATEVAARLAAALADRYTVEQELGQGGMATVYLARDLRHEREVAIKVLREDLSASLGSGRFLREIKIAAQLQHPHILPLLDSGEADGFLFFVMPYIKGQSLRERLDREGELPVHEAVRLLTEVVDALVEAHEHGVVHRDIKPDNVMLSGRHALVTDFGVAKAISEATGRNTVTTLGVAVGTPTYMSPEQAAADPHVDHRSDIYSVGVMAYEMLSGRPPFTGSTPQQVLAAHVTEAPDPVSKRRHAITPALDAIVMRCLAKRPADRFQTAAELHAALEPLATPSAGITPTQTRPTEATPSRRRIPLIVVGVGVVLAAILFVATRSHSPVQAAAPTPVTAQATTSGEAEVPSISPDGTRIAYATKRCDPAGSCRYDLVVQDIGGAGTLTVASGATGVYAQTWSPDGRYLVLFGSFLPQWGAYLIPATVQGPAQYLGCCRAEFLTTADTVLQSPLVNPGDTVAYLRIMTTADRRVRDSIRVSRPEVDMRAFPSADGKRILVAIERRNGSWLVRVMGRDGRITDTTSLTASLNGTSRVQWAPDGRGFLMAAAVPGTIDVYDVLHQAIDRSGRIDPQVDTIWHRATMQKGFFDLTLDGSTLAYAQGTRENKLVALRSTDGSDANFTQRIFATSTAGLTGGISPDGRQVALVRILTAGGDHPRIRLSLMPADSGAEVAASPPLDTLVDWTWPHGTGTGLMYLSPQSKGVDRLDGFDLPSGRATTLLTVPDTAADLRIFALPDGRLITFRATERDLVIRSASGAIDRRVPIPAGLYQGWNQIIRIASAPAGDEIALLGYDLATEDSMVIYRMRLADGVATEVAAIGGVEQGNGLQWLDNGDLLAVIGETSQTCVLYRVARAGGLKRLGILPYCGDAQYTIARDGLHVLVSLSDPHGDVWLVKNFGKMWRK
jgi:tRNA A-37 threonylcarbamoyl transferase component Bud32